MMRKTLYYFSAFEWLAGAVASVLVLYLYASWVETSKVAEQREVAQMRSLAPVNEWLTVKDIYVEDAFNGEDPLVVGDRIIHKKFPADWTVEIQRVEKSVFYLHCTGNGHNNYNIDDNLPNEIKLMGWWAQVPECKLPAGRYRACTSWEIQPPGYPTKIQEKCSNVFSIISTDGHSGKGG